MDLLDDATRARMENPRPRMLRVETLQPGIFGVLDVLVKTIQPVRTFQRKTGGEGQLRRVTLADATGEVDLVLWGDDVSAVTTEFQQGRRIRMRGPTIKAGWQGGVELSWDKCILEDAPAPAETQSLQGTLLEISDTRIQGNPPNIQFQADVKIAAKEGEKHVTLWNDAIKQLRQVLPGAPVTIHGLQPHPSLEDWYLGETARLG